MVSESLQKLERNRFKSKRQRRRKQLVLAFFARNFAVEGNRDGG